MKQNTLGIILKYYRKKFGFSQEQICDGICSVSTLSRIEKDNKDIDLIVIERLLGRIGKNIDKFELILDNDNVERWELRKAIEISEKNGIFLETRELLKAYYKRAKITNSKDIENKLHLQFFLFYDAKVMVREGFSKEEIEKKLEDALKLTKPDYENNNIQLFNELELYIILELFRIGYKNWIHLDREKEILKLIYYVETHYTDQVREQLISELYCYLVDKYEEENNSEKIIKYIDQIFNHRVISWNIQNVAQLHFQKARAIESLYHEKVEWKHEKLKCKKECLMSYCVANEIKNTELKLKIEEFCLEKLQWQSIKQEIL